MRIRAVCELIRNEKNYLNNQYLCGLSGTTGNMVEKLLPSSVNSISKDLQSSLRKEVLLTLRPYKFANMWHIFALANVLGCQIRSVYPDVQNAGTNRALLHITLRPENSVHDGAANVMWSHTSNLRRKGWGPNHFVPPAPIKFWQR